MSKTPFATTNFTGRKFMCMGLSENESIVGDWSHGFSIGGIYYECRLDVDNQNLCNEDLLLLRDENENLIYVDANSFVETEGMHKLINNSWIGLN